MRKWLRPLTPKRAWDQFVEDSVKKFVSEFYHEGYRDILEMCRKYAYDVLANLGKPYAQEEVEHLANLLKQYIEEAGYDENDLYTEEELDAMWQKDAEELLKLFSRFIEQ